MHFLLDSLRVLYGVTINRIEHLVNLVDVVLAHQLQLFCFLNFKLGKIFLNYGPFTLVELLTAWSQRLLLLVSVFRIHFL